jgi:hypothetical protein
MSDKTDKTPEEHYRELYDKFTAIPDDELAPINMPPEEAMQEGKRVSVLTAKYRDRILESEIDPYLVETVDARAEAYAYSVAACDIYVKDGEDLKEEYQAGKREGYALRSYLIEKLEYLFRHDKNALERIAGIREGKGNLDMIKDLLSIYKFCREMEEFLSTTKFDMALPGKAMSLHEELTHLGAEIAINPEKLNEAKRIRGKAWTYLYEALDEIYAAGRFVFMDEPVIKELFYIDYRQELAKKANREKNEEQEIVPVTE